MDSIEELREEMAHRQWAEGVRSAVLRHSLSFRPLTSPLMMARDAVWLKHTGETGDACDYILFARGSYDNFAAPVVRRYPDGHEDIAFPTDQYYFSRLCLLALKYGREEMYMQCRRLYAMTTDAVAPEVYALIEAEASRFGDDAGLFFNIMMHLYYGMIAEEHYQRRWKGFPTPQRTRMGKLMKMHALHRILVEGHDVDTASCECVNMNPDQLLEQAAGMGLTRTVTWHPYSTTYDDPDTLPELVRGTKKEV